MRFLRNLEYLITTRFVENIKATYQAPEQKIDDVCSAKYQIEVLNKQ